MDPITGEVRLFAFELIPQGWMPCDGTMLSIVSNPNLYSVLSPETGPEGRFALPRMEAPPGLFYCICCRGRYPSSEEMPLVRASWGGGAAPAPSA